MLHGKPAPPLPVLLARKWEGRRDCAAEASLGGKLSPVKERSGALLTPFGESVEPSSHRETAGSQPLGAAFRGHPLTRIHSFLRPLLATHLVRVRPCPRCWSLCGEEASDWMGSSRGSVPIDSMQCDELYSKVYKGSGRGEQERLT